MFTVFDDFGELLDVGEGHNSVCKVLKVYKVIKLINSVIARSHSDDLRFADTNFVVIPTLFLVESMNNYEVRLRQGESNLPIIQKYSVSNDTFFGKARKVS